MRLTVGAWAAEPARTGEATRGQLPEMAAGRVTKRIRVNRPRIRRERTRAEDLPVGTRDPDVVRAKALARARPGRQGKTAATAVNNRGVA
jgi:hypothetical protein